MIFKRLAPTALFLAALLLAAPFGNAVRADERGGALHQFGAFKALADGLYDGETTIAELKEHGTLGLGTFNGLDGEMVILDGTVYRVDAQGKAAPARDGDKTPWAQVIAFKTDRIQKLEEVPDLAALNALITKALPTRNIFYAMRIEGRFKQVKARSVPAQERPYPTLVEALEKQAVFKLTDVEGTMVGFRTPPLSGCVWPQGFHWHFLTKDGKAGGHVLDVTFTGLTAMIDLVHDFRLALPATSSYYEMSLCPNATNKAEPLKNP